MSKGKYPDAFFASKRRPERSEIAIKKRMLNLLHHALCNITSFGVCA